MVSGVRSSCDSFPPKVRRYCVCSLRRARRRSKSPRQGADLVGAGGLRHFQPDLSVAAHRRIGRIAQTAYAEADPSGEAEHDDDRGRSVASRVKLNRRVTARSRNASS